MVLGTSQYQEKAWSGSAISPRRPDILRLNIEPQDSFYLLLANWLQARRSSAMTVNQRRAVCLATRVLNRDANEAELPETDWHLLLLAAGSNDSCALIGNVAQRVLRDAVLRQGYFTRGVADPSLRGARRTSMKANAGAQRKFEVDLACSRLQLLR